MCAFVVCSCRDIPVDSNNLIFYLKKSGCEVKSPYRPFHTIEPTAACILMDLCQEALALPPASLLDMGYDAGCADVANIPLVILTEEPTKIPKEWRECEHVYPAKIENLKEVIDIFIKTISKAQMELNLAKKADLQSRRDIRLKIMEEVNSITKDETTKLIENKKFSLIK